MGASPRANQPGKPLFGNGEHLATVGEHKYKFKYYIIRFPWCFSTAEIRTLQHLALSPQFDMGLNVVRIIFLFSFFAIVFVCLLIYAEG